MSTFLSFSPFLVLIYVIFAFVQAVRQQRQSIIAAIVAVAVVVIPIAAYVTSTDAATRLALMSNISFSIVILFLGSVIILFIERRNSKRDKNRSYGILGIAMTVLLAFGLILLPMTQTAPSAPSALNAAPTGSNGLVNVSSPNNAAGSDQASAAAGTTVATVLAAETGLTTTEIATRLENGSTIAQLVAANGGDLEAVITAIATVLDTVAAGGGMPAQMMGSLGSGSADIATKLVEGQLPAQVQQGVTTMLVSGNAAPQQGAPAGFAPAQIPATAIPATSTPVPPTTVVVRPTLIAFPSATPTPAASEEVVPESTAESVVESAATCMIVVDYNLNLRDKPAADTSTVLLSIPFGTLVSTTGRTATNWYSVTYEGQSGWLSGEYVTPQAACSQLPQLAEVD